METKNKITTKVTLTKTPTVFSDLSGFSRPSGIYTKKNIRRESRKH